MPCRCATWHALGERRRSEGGRRSRRTYEEGGRKKLEKRVTREEEAGGRRGGGGAGRNKVNENIACRCVAGGTRREGEGRREEEG
ncbi:hypothetical protein CBR_g39226 [Chara braunii]|uniref:Uncharacterized protein n=1 Tax=Chara braunii TaxID=69332 RepID=A0A388LR93_CHABU|nr:hypothetical protein CBR_g39226 [Chara braunii]|eukprot:GBG84850.1 hypothetical protein CBR_g39226 [Chara braunii]